MKWILVFFAFWNLAGALLRTFRILLERFPLFHRFYPDRDARPLDEISNLDLGAAARNRYEAAVEKLSRDAGVTAPELFCTPKSAMIAGTRGWQRHQLHLSLGILNHARDGELLAVIAHELGHIYYRHFAVLRLTEVLTAVIYARVVFVLCHGNFSWYAYLGLWSLLDFSFSLSRLAIGSVTELMADHFAAHKLHLAEDLSRGLIRAQCFNGVTEFTQITHFYPTVRLRVRLLARYGTADSSSWLFGRAVAPRPAACDVSPGSGAAPR
jgi:Zn-dependent protease with chaperone function